MPILTLKSTRFWRSLISVMIIEKVDDDFCVNFSLDEAKFESIASLRLIILTKD